jgi:hypothetical protein
VLIHATAMGGEKVLERYPVTEDGWGSVWVALVAVGTSAAEIVPRALAERATHLAAQAAGRERRSRPDAKTNDSRLLGPLRGAEAAVSGGSQAWSPGRAVFLPIGLAGMATKAKAHAVIVFAAGTVHTTKLNGNSAVRDAQLEAVRFNAAAGPSGPQASESPSDRPAGCASSRNSWMRAC